MTGGSVSESAAELKPIRIFICSSGDMIAERQAALCVIEAVNRAAHGGRLARALSLGAAHAPLPGRTELPGQYPAPRRIRHLPGLPVLPHRQPADGGGIPQR